MQKIISIITVTKNDISRLKKTINSLNIFYNDDRYEHIIIDGGSSDGTIDYLETLQNISNLNVRSYVDSGIYDAMNTGIDLSKGKFLNFLNCGDCITISPDELIKCIEPYLEKSLADILCFNFEEDFGLSIKRRRLGKIKAHKLPCSHQAMLFLAKYIKGNLYRIKYKIAADYDLYSSTASSRILVVENSEPFVRVEGLGFASSNPIRAYREYLDIAKHNFQGLQRIRVLSAILARAIAVISLKSLASNAAYNFLKSRY
jgi:putative colanic acid biosynthesis glycosyltransferase